MEITTVPIHYIHSISEAARTHGYDPDPLLDSAGISRDLLAGPKARVSAAAFARFTGALSTRMQDENCGMMAQKTRLGTFAMMCRACASCATLGLFLERCTEFNALVNDCVVLKLSCDGDVAQYSITPIPGKVDPEQLIIQVLLAITQRLASWAIAQTIVLESVSIARDRPSYANDYNLLFMAPVRFGQKRNSLQFKAAYLDMPLTQDAQSLERFLTVPSMQLMSNPETDNSQVAKIRKRIKHEVGGGFPEFESVAESLHTTTATLRRRLRREGSSYQQIKDDIRRDTAIYHLGRGAMSMEQVAESVGFSEPTSFFRAFKRWTGVTPRSYLKSESE